MKDVRAAFADLYNTHTHIHTHTHTHTHTQTHTHTHLHTHTRTYTLTHTHTQAIKIGQTRADPGATNTLLITLTPAFTLLAPTSLTLGGLMGTQMVHGVSNVVDCLPSPCLSVSDFAM